VEDRKMEKKGLRNKRKNDGGHAAVGGISPFSEFINPEETRPYFYWGG